MSSVTAVLLLLLFSRRYESLSECVTHIALRSHITDGTLLSVAVSRLGVGTVKPLLGVDCTSIVSPWGVPNIPPPISIQLTVTSLPAPATLVEGPLRTDIVEVIVYATGHWCPTAHRSDNVVTLLGISVMSGLLYCRGGGTRDA